MRKLDKRQYAPATQRNREAILEVLSRILPPDGTVLEIATGTGEHAVFLAPPLLPRYWLPSDPLPMLRDSINAWQKDSPSDNLHPPLDINASDSLWCVETSPPNPPITAIVCINMIHIAPWSACVGLIAGAARVLPPDGILYLYGPYKEKGKTAPSNMIFDQGLREQNPEWGVRDLEEVIALAKDHHLSVKKVVTMPANNLSVIFTTHKK